MVYALLFSMTGGVGVIQKFFLDFCKFIYFCYLIV
jgi:hypothetical protein